MIKKHTFLVTFYLLSIATLFAKNECTNSNTTVINSKIETYVEELEYVMPSLIEEKTSFCKAENVIIKLLSDVNVDSVFYNDKIIIEDDIKTLNSTGTTFYFKKIKEYLSDFYSLENEKYKMQCGLQIIQFHEKINILNEAGILLNPYPTQMNYGDSYIISWERSNYLGKLILEVWEENERLNTIATKLDGDSFQWSIDDIGLVGKKLKLVLKSEDEKIIETGNTFSVVTEPIVTLNDFPDSLPTGMEQIISWTSKTYIGPVNVELWQDGARLIRLSENTSANQITWKIGENYTSRKPYVIKVLAHNQSNTFVSSKEIYIQKPEIIFENMPEVFLKGEAYKISWQRIFYNGPLTLTLLKGYKPYKTLTENQYGGGIYWNVDIENLEKAEYAFRITASDIETISVLSKPFKVIADKEALFPKLRFTSVPNTIQKEKTVKITWDKDNYDGPVRLDWISPDGLFHTVDSSILLRESQLWIPQDFPTKSGYKLKLTALEEENLEVLSKEIKLKKKIPIIAKMAVFPLILIAIIFSQV